MDGNEIGVLKEIDEVALGRLLQGEDSRGLETKIRIEVLGDLTDKAIERSPGGSNKLKDSICKIITCKNLLADEIFGSLLILPNHTESHSARLIPPLLLFVTCLVNLLPSLQSKAPTRSLAASALARGLLAACHGNGAVEKYSREFLLCSGN